MAAFSSASMNRLSTCHPDLQKLFNEVIKHVDCSIICGHRTLEEQKAAFMAGASFLVWPRSRHNKNPSEAVDVGIVPLAWGDVERWKQFAVVVKECATRLGITVHHGGDWKMRDYPHWEVRPEKKEAPA